QLLHLVRSHDVHRRLLLLLVLALDRREGLLAHYLPDRRPHREQVLVAQELTAGGSSAAPRLSSPGGRRCRPRSRRWSPTRTGSSTNPPRRCPRRTGDRPRG